MTPPALMMKKAHVARTQPLPASMEAHRLYSCLSSIYLPPRPVRHQTRCGWPHRGQLLSRLTHFKMRIRKKPSLSAVTCLVHQEKRHLTFRLKSNKWVQMLDATDLIHQGVMLKITRPYASFCQPITLDLSIHYARGVGELVRLRSAHVNWPF